MLPTLDAPELVFGLCSPVGTDNAKVIEILKAELSRFEYEAHRIKVTDLMKNIIIADLPLDDSSFQSRYNSYIRYANKVRELYKFPSTLAMLCCTAIRAFRFEKTGRPKSYLPKTAYILDQLKRKEEVEALRQVYGRAFILIYIVSDKETRCRIIVERIARDDAASRPARGHEDAAKELMDRDEEESNDPNGQRMRDAFALADLFVNIDYKDATEKLMRRFLEAQFGSNKISPTREEYGMYLAKTASLRSVDLSRQVGAAIMSPLGEIISLGCNEVPSPGGGTYWSDSSPDHRDFVKGLDENERIKRALLVDIVKRLTDSGLIQSTLSDVELRQKVLDHSMTKGSPVRDALLMDLLEFGRVIHAEMCALCDSARLGRSVKNSRLFCTTFPCHMCSKHIIAAGIMDVYYVEPYPKSYAEQLHSDAIVVTTKDDEHETRVRFHPFVGIAPHRYRDLFERGKRKGDSGDFAEWLLEAGGKPKPTFRFTVASYLDNELAFARLLEDRTKVLTANGLVRVERASESGE